MNAFRRSAFLDRRSHGAVLPVYLGLYLVLFAFFVYFVAVTAEQHRMRAAVAEEVPARAQPAAAIVELAPAPALRPLVEAFRTLTVPGGSGEPGEPFRLEVAVAPERIFIADGAVPRPDFAPVLDQMARALSMPSGASSRDGASADEILDLQLLVGLPVADASAVEPASVTAILAERLAIVRAAALARALLARGTPPARFALGVAPEAGQLVRFLFRLDHPDAQQHRA